MQQWSYMETEPRIVLPLKWSCLFDALLTLDATDEVTQSVRKQFSRVPRGMRKRTGDHHCCQTRLTRARTYAPCLPHSGLNPQWLDLNPPNEIPALVD
ncbi:unnamed protein product [Dibothriocephalus latus]|uniref:Uncharacterized protein n=1 Tax=Dibothriocephalus latus TaxID=60516 RepID=A0A3P7R4D1_DIBLA|nr:unnamed protein product [Dibothriocephalus latus]